MPTTAKNPCRIVINLGNAMLASPLGTSGAKGISVDIAREWCRQSHCDSKFLIVQNAREAVTMLENKEADLGFLAVDPGRAEHLQFTQPYLNIDGCYLVKANSSIIDNQQIDDASHRVVVGLGSAYDLYLSRHLKAAKLIKAPSSKEVVDCFIREQADVAAGVKQQLENDMKTYTGLRLLQEPFMQIQQALVIHRHHGNAALKQLQAFISSYISDGALAASIKHHGVEGVTIASQQKEK
jgi:polar amino acid transport system substrate-binding protein